MLSLSFDAFDTGSTVTLVRYSVYANLGMPTLNPTKIMLTVSVKPRRFSYAEKSEITNQIQKWLDNKVMRPSSSDYASPIVLVKKKNGSTRLYVDYCKLNRKIIKDQFPLPLIEDVIDKLHSAKIFTTLDLKNGFFHVPIDESSKKYTAFITDQGLFEFNFAPFGLCLSPPVFQRYVSYVLRDLLRDDTILVYMDDIIIPSKNIEEGITKLERVLVTAAKFGLEINFKKCQFLYSKIEFLGYLIENGTIKPSPVKLLRPFIISQNPSQLKTFNNF
ncbi:hypothetical protein TNCV_3176901 [Trichonephila clavipes]|nr:hypothetical protein TNCV_3176901 [Trichonephila clavipes]